MQLLHLQQHISLMGCDVYLIASHIGLVKVTTQKQTIPFCDVTNPAQSQHAAILYQAQKELIEFCSQLRTTFTVPLDIKGTDFQKRVWAQLQHISYGTTISYKELATRVGSPRAARAVGAANGQNPLWIIIPCHRVIQSDGSLGGYAGGNTLKAYLINLEKTKLL